jgi:O-antigen ligase
MIRTAQDLYTVLVMILSTGAFLTIIIGSNNPSAIQQGSPVYTVLWGMVYAISLARFIRQRQRMLRLMGANRAWVLLVFLCFASASWSINPLTSIHGGVTLLFTSLFALDMSLRYPLRKQLSLVCIALVTVVALSVVAEVVLPGVVPGRDLEQSAWHGVFGFKNDFGKMVCLCVIACLACARRSTALRLAIVATGLTITILSRSVSASLYTLAFAGLFKLWDVLKWRPKPRKAALALLALVGVVATQYTVGNWSHITSLLGKDPHLTGRTELWRLAIADIRDRPVFGYGYEAFWGAKSQPARRIREEIHWDDAPHSHDGYIDFSLSLGMAGLATYCIFYISVLRRAYLLLMNGRESYRRFPITYMVFIFAYQITESSIVVGNAFEWIMLCTLTFSLSAPRVRRVADVADQSHHAVAA